MPEVQGGKPIYKAKHLPPDGTLTMPPAGHWDGDPNLVDTIRFYAWEGVGEQANTFAIRNIATQPVFAPHPAGAYLTNTVYCVRLAQRFPLNVWSVSRVVAWFMAMTARTSVVQGFFTTFYPRQTMRMPIPAKIDDGLITELDALGARMFAADHELASGDERINEIVDGAGSQRLRNRVDLVEKGEISRPTDVSWPAPSSDWGEVSAVVEGGTLTFTTTDERGETVAAPTASGIPCVIKVDDPKLMDWIAFQAGTRLKQGKLPDRNWLRAMPIPDDIDAAAELVHRHLRSAALEDLNAAVADLDHLAARELGLDDQQLQHILNGFRKDDMLKNVVPHWRHRVRRGLIVDKQE